jgi:uncharacterized protein
VNRAFAPWQTLAAYLLGGFDASGTDGSHDLSHIVRVWRNARRIAATEPGSDTELLLAGVILHDCVAVEKNAPRRSEASRFSAIRARDIVAPLNWAPDRVSALAHAIEAHSFSAGLPPMTREAKILQDADRLDAIGAIGIARCFHVSGRMSSALYHPWDPTAESRPLDDRHYALDHFAVKLFKVADGFLTKEGQRMAAKRTGLMRQFVDTFHAEIEGSMT